MARFAFAFAAVLIALFASAAPVPVVPVDQTKDRDGNPLPRGATARLGSRPFLNKGWYGLAFSADGKRLLAFSGIKQVRAWDAETGKTLSGLTLKWGQKSDGEQTIACAIAGSRAIWITESISRAAPTATTTAYAFDLADGSEIAHVRLAGRVKFDALPHRLSSAATSADGKYLAAASDKAKTVEVFDVATGKRLHTHQLTGAGDPGVGFAPDARTLYIAEYKKPLRRVEPEGGKELAAVSGADHEIDLLAASPDGKLLATRGWVSRKQEEGKEVGEAFLAVHDVAAGKPLGKLELDGRPLDFGFAGAESVVVLAAKYRPALSPVYTLSRWNATTLKQEWEVRRTDLPYKFSLRLIVAPDGKRFAFTDHMNFVDVHDAATGKLLVEPSGHAGRVAWVGFSADGELVTTVGSDGMRTWTLKGDRKNAAAPPELTRGRIHPTLFGEHLVWVSYSEDGKKAELVGWNRAKGESAWRMPADDEGHDRVMTHDGNRVVRLSPQKKAPLWNVVVYDGPAGKKLHAWSFKPENPLGTGGLGPTALSPDGETLYVGGTGMAALDVKSGKEKSRLEIGNIDRVESYSSSPLALSPDGSRLALATRNVRGGGHTLRIYDVKTGQSIAEHDLGEVYQPGVRFSPNGKSVAVWNMWGATVQVCDAKSSLTAPRKLEASDHRLMCVAFSPNNSNLVVGYEDGTALVWDLTAK